MHGDDLNGNPTLEETECGVRPIPIWVRKSIPDQRRKTDGSSAPDRQRKESIGGQKAISTASLQAQLAWLLGGDLSEDISSKTG